VTVLFQMNPHVSKILILSSSEIIFRFNAFFFTGPLWCALFKNSWLTKLILHQPHYEITNTFRIQNIQIPRKKLIETPSKFMMGIPSTTSPVNNNQISLPFTRAFTLLFFGRYELEILYLQHQVQKIQKKSWFFVPCRPKNQIDCVHHSCTKIFPYGVPKSLPLGMPKSAVQHQFVFYFFHTLGYVIPKYLFL
jgi:hypothetical protein